MADRVIVTGIRRGGATIRPSELRQMMGRAGRRHGCEAVVELIVDETDIPSLDEVLSDKAIAVESTLCDADLVSMSMMPEIDRGVIDSLDSAQEWYSRSMSARPAVEKALDLLFEVGAIEGDAECFHATEIGVCASRMYFHPADVASWRRNFEQLFALGLENDDVAAAWALGNVPFDRMVGDVSKHRESLSDCIHRIPIGLSAMEGSRVNIFGWWCLMSDTSAGAIRPACVERRKNFGRYKAVLEMLNDAYGWDSADYIEEVEIRIRKGVLSHLVPLCKLHISKNKAKYLYDLGIRSIDDFSYALEVIDDENLCKPIRAALESSA